MNKHAFHTFSKLGADPRSILDTIFDVCMLNSEQSPIVDLEYTATVEGTFESVCLGSSGFWVLGLGFRVQGSGFRV